MTNLNERNCVNCGLKVDVVYTQTNGYKYTRNDTIYCSKSCASKARYPVKGCIIADVGKEALASKAKNFILEKGSYCTGSEVCVGTKHSSKLFVKHGLKISELNAEAGFDKPKSKFQENVGELLSKNFQQIHREKTFEGLVGTTGHPLRVDFYLPEINAVVEADGSQHSDPKHPWANANKNGSVAEYDKIKDKFFEGEGIRVIRVPYKRNLKESEILSRLS